MILLAQLKALTMLYNRPSGMQRRPITIRKQYGIFICNKRKTNKEKEASQVMAN